MYHDNVNCNMVLSEASVRIIPLSILAGLRVVSLCNSDLLPIMICG